MFVFTYSLTNDKMICAFGDLSRIDKSSGVMAFAADPIIDFLLLVTSQGGQRSGSVLRAVMGAVVSMYGSNCCYLFMEKMIWKL